MTLRGYFLGLVAPLLLGLVACGSKGYVLETIAFASDPRILRGNWVGKACPLSVDCPSGTLKLTVSASYQSETSYRIEGSLTLADGPALTLSGEHSGPSLYRYVSLRSLSTPPAAHARGTITDGGRLVYNFVLSTHGGGRYLGWLFSPEGDGRSEVAYYLRDLVKSP